MKNQKICIKKTLDKKQGGGGILLPIMLCNLIRYCIEISFIILLIVISFFDLRTFKIPNELVIALFSLAVIKLILNDSDLGNFIKHFLYTIIFTFLLIIIRKITYNGIGFGDIKLLSTTTLYYGFIVSYFALFIATVLGILFLLAKKIFGDFDYKRIPFAPFICFGYGVVSLIKRVVV